MISAQKLIAKVTDFLRREIIEIQILLQRLHSEAEQILALYTVRAQAVPESSGILGLEEGYDIGDWPT